MALVLLGTGCQGPGIPSAEIPSAPMAISWREPELARRRAESMAARGPAQARQRHEKRWEQVGVLPVDQVQPLLESLFGPGGGADPNELAGRLALFHPDTREVVSLPALRGSWPQAWSPDRRRLLFSQPDGPGTQLFEYRLETDEVLQVTHGPALHPNGCYGPDGRLVLMRVDPAEDPPVTRIVLTAAGGVDPEPLSPGPADHSPVCAPDGSAVVYVASSARGPDRLFSVALGGEGTPRRLGPGHEPAFSPDGSVVFSARVGGQWQIWRIRPGGGGRARIGRGVLDETHPAVSPDGDYVVYVVDQSYRKALYLRRIDGSGDRILFRDGDAEFPVW